MSIAHALRVLNAAAYDAAKAARAECRWVLADELRKIALRTDELVDDLPPKPATEEAAE